MSQPYTPPQNPLDIIYEDSNVIICVKPSGLLSVPGKGVEKSDCLESRLKLEFENIYTVHRLDMETSGIMVFARNKEAQSHLNKQFSERKVQKEYIADIYGSPDQTSGVITAPLICDWPNRPKQIVDFEIGKPSETHYKVINILDKENTRVRLFPLTGRSHQLRVHMLHIGHPIIGDSLYAQEYKLNETGRMHLHASKLEFHSPVSGELLSFSDEPDF